jgi:endoglucanase
LWIKRPGESDGSCGKGDPPAGNFVNQYAIDLAQNAGQ